MGNKKPTAKELLSVAKQTLERMTSEGDEMFLPMLTYSPAGDDKSEAIVVLDGEDDLPKMLATSLYGMHKMLGPASWVALTADSFAQHIPKEDEKEFDENYRRGGLAERFGKGDPSVVEVMMVIVMDADTQTDVAGSIHRYLPSEENVEWEDLGGEGDPNEEAPAGMVQDVIEGFFTYQKVREMLGGGDLSHQQIKEAIRDIQRALEQDSE